MSHESHVGHARIIARSFNGLSRPLQLPRPAAAPLLLQRIDYFMAQVPNAQNESWDGPSSVWGAPITSGSGLTVDAESAPQLGFMNMPKSMKPRKEAENGNDDEEEVDTKNINCSFFMRAYGEKCKFKHPNNTAPPELTARGYPLREGEPICTHYLKKGWCAFGLSCKFNHPMENPASTQVDALMQLLDAPLALASDVMAHPHRSRNTSSLSLAQMHTSPSQLALTSLAGSGRSSLAQLHLPNTSVTRNNPFGYSGPGSSTSQASSLPYPHRMQVLMNEPPSGSLSGAMVMQNHISMTHHVSMSNHTSMGNHREPSSTNSISSSIASLGLGSSYTDAGIPVLRGQSGGPRYNGSNGYPSLSATDAVQIAPNRTAQDNVRGMMASPSEFLAASIGSAGMAPSEFLAASLGSSGMGPSGFLAASFGSAGMGQSELLAASLGGGGMVPPNLNRNSGNSVRQLHHQHQHLQQQLAMTQGLMQSSMHNSNMPAQSSMHSSNMLAQSSMHSSNMLAQSSMHNLNMPVQSSMHNSNMPSHDPPDMLDPPV
eukprot:gene25232-10878_t